MSTTVKRKIAGERREESCLGLLSAERRMVTVERGILSTTVKRNIAGEWRVSGGAAEKRMMAGARQEDGTLCQLR